MNRTAQFLSPLLFSLVLTPAPMRLVAQGQWPMVIEAKGYTATIYTPQPESYKDGRFTARAAVSVKSGTEKNPVFGAIWASGFLEVDRSTRMGELRQFVVTDVRFPSVTDTAKVRRVKEYLTTEIPKHVAPVSIDLIVSALENDVQQDGNYRSDPPEIIYRDKPSLLLSIDGEPIYDPLPNTGYERVLNSALVLVKAGTGTHYLYASSTWYTAPAAKGPYQAASSVPQDLQRVSQKVDSAMKASGAYTAPDGRVPEVIVRTTPAELLQTDGAADMKPVSGTELLSARNAGTPLFLDLASQQYYVLLSGRWYAGGDLAKGPWRHVKGTDLPPDFAKIPEGSEEDEVLASIPGTKAATEAARDAMIPQTAAVDRKNVSLQVTYKGEPEWKAVDGTNMSYAINASSTVLKVGDHYHVCDNAVWYDGPTPNGPWAVSTEVPEAVSSIEPSSPVYNVKYVDVYESTPEVVYVGYTPGYTGTYVYGGTVVYGTGWYYPPPPPIYYYPRPATWGFSVHYNPWTGWSMGVHYSAGWFHFSAYGGWGAPYHCGGWWGPPMYHPPYPPHHPPGGYYGHRPPYGGGGNTINIDNSTNINVGNGNIYDRTDRPGVKPSQPTAGRGQGNATRPSTMPAGGADKGGAARPFTRPAGKPEQGGATKPSTRPADGGRDVYADPQGNVYRGEGTGTQQYDNGKWNNVPQNKGGYDVSRGGGATQPSTRPAQPSTRPAQPQTRPSTGDPYRMQQDRARGQQRSSNFNQYQNTAPRGGGGGGTRQAAPRSGGGRAR